MPKSLSKRKRGLQSYLGAVETLPCVLTINQTLDIPAAPFAIPVLRSPGALAWVPRAESAPSGSRHRPALLRKVPKSRRAEPSRLPTAAMVPGESERRWGEQGTVPPRARPREGCVRGAARPTHHGAHHPCRCTFPFGSGIPRKH